MTSALIGASSVRQLEDNVGALASLDSTNEELAEIDVRDRQRHQLWVPREAPRAGAVLDLTGLTRSATRASAGRPAADRPSCRAGRSHALDDAPLPDAGGVETV